MHRIARVTGAALSCVLPAALLLLSGCQGASTWSSASLAPTVALSGTVYTGKQPISNSTVQLYVAGTDGIGSSAQPLLPEAVRTDSNGLFTIKDPYTCPSPSSKVYVAAQGGNPGLSTGSDNNAIALMALLGTCEELSMHKTVTLNEVTTVGSVSPVSSYMKSMSLVGSSTSDPLFPAAVARVSQLVDVSQGVSPGIGLPDGYAVPISKLNSLANVLAACAGSSGGVSGDGSACGKLFELATPPGGDSPTDTAAAAMYIARNPTIHVGEIFALAQSASDPFHPSLTAAPQDFALALVATPAAPVISPASGTYAPGQAITMSSTTSGSTIYYTLDGSTPTSNSSVYSSALSLSAAETISAIATLGGVSSSTSSATYLVSNQSLFLSIANVGLGMTSTGTVSVPSAATADVPVSLSSSSSSLISISPATVTIPKGTTYTSFSYTGVSAGIVMLTATAPGYATGTRRLAAVPDTPVFQPAPGSYPAGQTIALSSDSGAAIHYTLDGSAPTAGSPTYNLPLVLSATEMIKAIAVQGGQTSTAASGAYTLQPSQLVFATQPSNITVGSAFIPAVSLKVEDPSGNILSSSAAITLSIASNPSGGTLTGTATATAVNGVATFPGLSVSSAGSGYTLSATGSGISSAVSAAFAVTPAGAPVLSGANITVGSTGIGTLTLPAPTSPLSVSLTSSLPSEVSVSPSTLSIAAGQSSATFSYTGVSAGIATLTAVVPGYSSTTLRVADAPTVPVTLPASGTYPTGQSITLSSTSGSVIYYTLDGTAPTTSSLVYTTPLTLSAAEKVKAIAVANGIHSQPSYAIYAVSPTQLAFASQPSNINAGSVFSPAISVRVTDASGNLVSSSASITLSLATNPGGATLVGTSTVAAVNGTATFSNLSVSSGGTGYTLKATGSGAGSATSATFNVAQVIPLLSATNVMVGATATGSITVPSPATVAVAFSLSSSAPTYVSVSPATVNIAAGQTTGSFTYTGSAAGAATLTATASGYTTATVQIATVPDTPVISPGSGSYASGQAITISSNSGNTLYYTLDGSTPTTSSPVYTAPLILSQAETVKVLAVSNGQSSAISSATYTLNSTGTTQLAFATQPTNIVVGATFAASPRLYFVSSTGARLTTAAPITLTLTSNPGNGTLTGTTTITSTSGISTFSGLSVNAVGNGYMIIASSPGVTSVVSTSFNVTSVPPPSTYYVSNSGNDGNLGTSSTTPWKTIAKVNASSFVAGSSVLLQCGSVFRETLAISGAGTASLPLTYGSYGTCTGSNLPILNGSDLLTSWTPESVGSFTAYYASETTAPKAAFEDNHRLALVTAKTSLTNGTWYYDGTNKRVYVRTRENASPTSAHTIEANIKSSLMTAYDIGNFQIVGIEADKASTSAILFGGNLNNIQILNTITNYSAADGIRFTANTGQYQNNILIKGCVASYNGASGVEKGNGGTNFVIDGCTANYNAYDPSFHQSGGIKFISDGTTDANRITNSGIRNSTAGWTGVNPETGAQVPSSTNSGVGIWCDTCGNGAFLTHNVAHNSTQAGIQIEFSGTTGTRTMSYNIGYANYYGILHTRRSHNDLITNNTTYGNFVNCQFDGEYPGGETVVGMVDNIYQNNLCSSHVLNSSGIVFVAIWGSENNTKGEGSGNVYRNNSFGVPGATNGHFAEYGYGNYVNSYGVLDADYGANMGGAVMNSMQADPLLNDPAAGDFSLKAGSPAIGAGYGGVDIGAIPYTQP